MLFTVSLATTEVTPCDLSDEPCSLSSVTIKPPAYENTLARQNLELIVTCPLVGVFSYLLPSVSFDPMTPPNWIHSHFGAEHRVKILGEENSEAIWPTQPNKAWLSYFPPGFQPKPGTEGSCKQEFRLIHIRSHDQILLKPPPS